MWSLRSVCGKARRDRIKNEWVLNECGLITKMSEWYEKIQVIWANRMNENHIVKQICKGGVNELKLMGRPRK